MKKDYEEYIEPEYTEEEYVPEEGEYSEEYAEGEEYYAEGEEEYYAEDGSYEEGEYYADEAYEDGAYEEGQYYEEGAYEGEVYEGEYYEGEEYYAEEYYETEAYEDDFVYEDDLTVAPKAIRPKRKKGLFTSIGKMSMMDKLITTTGVLVLVLALVVGSLYITANTEQQQVSSFDTVGQQLAYIDSYIGEAGLMAVADAEQARIDAANAVEKEEDKNDFWEEYEENDYVNEVVVKMNLTTIQKDLKIKFVNKKTSKLIGNVPFQVVIAKPDGSKETMSDDDMDGVIYLTELAGGKYTVTMQELADEKYAKYDISTSGKSVNVKEEIKYEKVDVADEVKDESEVDAKKEDTAQKEEIKVESELKDTVTWVESTKNQVYEAVKKADVKDPGATASIGSLFYRLTEDGDLNPPADDTTTAVESVTLNPGSLALEVGGTSTLTATVVKTGEISGDVTWTSSNPEVASVAGGVVTANGVGDATITATSVGDANISASCSVTVTAPTAPTAPTVAVTGVSISGASEVTVGASIRLTATVQPANATEQTVTWNTSDATKATVSDGVVTGVTAGTVTITASCGDVRTEHTVTVKAANVAVESVTLDKTTAEVMAGETVTLTATVAPADATDKTVEWTSADNAIATVSNGVVTGVAAGTTTVTVKSVADPSKSATCTVTVKEEITLTISPSTLTLDLINVKEGTLTANVTGLTGTDAVVAWSSSKTEVATVAANGVVTAKTAGEAIITATLASNPNITATCTVTVTSTDATLITLNKTTANVFTKGVIELVATTTPEGVPVTWKSSNTEVATVDANGKVTGVKEGTVEITASVPSSTGPLVAKCTVTVVKLMKLEKSTLSMVKGASVAVNVILGDDGKGTIRAFSASPEILKVEVKDKTVVFTALAMSSSVGVTVNYTRADGTLDSQDIYVSITDNSTKLTDKSGKQLYVLGADGKYVEAVVSDYYKYDTFYVQTTRYTGWQTINGKVFFFNVDGKYVTGEQVIQGAKYKFASDGSLVTGDGVFGIDVSKWNGTIDWNAVKNSGVSYVIIRCGYRGSTQGALIEDPKFEKNIKGATAAGLKVGVYFFTQAINEVEAVEEASMVLGLIKNYKISYPVFLDVESSGGRADGLNSATRTKVIKAFCETIENSGYTAGIYANKSWFEKKMDVSQLTKYKIWLAQYASTPTYTKSKIDIWQYKSTGKVSGISGNVDLNISYLGY